MNTTENHLTEMGISALWAMFESASTRLQDVTDKGYFGITLERYTAIRDEYAAELNRRGYEAE
jgi:hypothetical protein